MTTRNIYELHSRQKHRSKCEKLIFLVFKLIKNSLKKNLTSTLWNIIIISKPLKKIKIINNHTFFFEQKFHLVSTPLSYYLLDMLNLVKLPQLIKPKVFLLSLNNILNPETWVEAIFRQLSHNLKAFHCIYDSCTLADTRTIKKNRMKQVTIGIYFNI